MAEDRHNIDSEHSINSEHGIDSDHDDLIAQLADLDEASELGENGTIADSTVKELRAELETLLSDVREPPPVDEFENESGCRRAMEMVQEIGRDPSFTGAQAAKQIESEGEDLGSLREYQLLSKLGQGGMGTVYKALHTKLDKIVALKVLPTDKLRDEHAVTRFEREMKAVGRLEHPNIVRATDTGEVDGKHFLVMEHVDGLDLSTVVRSTGPLSIADACEVIRQSAIGLQHANEHGLVHRDIKPSNIMLAKKVQSRGSRVKSQKQPTATSGPSPSTLDSRPSVKILDMGLALLEEHRHAEQRDLTTTGQMMGTLDYMAPEQGLDSHEVDIRADIYSLGATLFKLLCGEAPFAGKKYKTPMQVLLAIATDPAPSIADRRDDVPAELAAIVDRMLQKSPDDRFATPQEVAKALEPFAGDCDLADLLERAENDLGSEDGSLIKTGEYLSSPSTETEENAKEPVRSSSDQTDRFEETQLASALPGAAAWYRRPRNVVAVALAFAGIVLAAVIIRVMTDTGELIVRSDDDNVQVTVRRHNGEPVEEIELTKGKTTLRSGKYEVLITGDNADQFKISPNVVTLSRNGSEVVTIERKAKEVLATTNIATAMAKADPDRRVAQWVLSVGGHVQTRTGNEFSDIRTGDELPNRGFRITAINLQNAIAKGSPARILRDANEVTDNELANLAGLNHRVSSITLSGNRGVTDNGLKHLVALKQSKGFQLNELNLGGTNVTDEGMKAVASLQLTALTLSAGRISDQGLEHLAENHEFVNLYLDRTRVSDAGLPNLYGLENLRTLY